MTSSLLETLSKYQIKLDRVGAYHKGHCPFMGHADNTPSFVVYPETNTCWCFGCNRGGGLLQFLMYHKGISRAEAQKLLGNNKDTVGEVEEILKPTEPKDSSFNVELNYVVSQLAREAFQKGQTDLVLNLLEKFDQQLIIKDHTEQQAKEIISNFQNNLNRGLN